MVDLMKELGELETVIEVPPPDFSAVFAGYRERIHTLKAWEFKSFLQLQHAWDEHRDDPAELEHIERALEEIFVPRDATYRIIEPAAHRRLIGERLTLAKFIGDQMKKQREAKGITQQDLAKLSGLGQSHICRLENGEHTPTRATVEKIATALGVEARLFDPLEK